MDKKIKLHKNLLAYDNFENIKTKKEKLLYRQEKLKSCSNYIELIKKFTNEKINFLELGSGNSKISISLELNNLLIDGFNFEISKNRVLFANEWCENLNLKNIHNIRDNFMEIEKYNLPKIDVCLSIDLSFQFIEPLKSGSDLKLLKKIHNILGENGVLILELDSFDKMLELFNNDFNIWEEFDKPDPWIYSLWKLDYNSKKNFLSWKKNYISRDFKKMETTEITLMLYKKIEIQKLLISAGFKKIEFLEGFNNKNTEFIVIAKK